jgi:rhamnogalacturonan acetylesterase
MNAKLPLIFFLGLFSLINGVLAQADGPAGRPYLGERAQEATKSSIFVCGDSTAKNTSPGKNGEPLVGWGTPIANYFDSDKVLIKNVAHAGQSSLTYYNRDWPNVLPQIKSGDFVLLVFGINDGTTPPGLGEETVLRTNQPIHTYGWYMGKMATDAGAKGAHVYLLTVTTRNIWTNPKVKYNDGAPSSALPADYDPKDDKIERGTGNGRFTQWTKDLGKKLHLPVLDLTNLCADKYEAMGRETVNKFYSDHNHTYLSGAQIVAASIVSGLKAFPNSPFLPLLSDEGTKVETADAKYVSKNLEPVNSSPAIAK